MDRTYTIINDVHLGCTRQGGATPQSQAALKNHLQESFGAFLQGYTEHPLIIAGDLFDNFEVDTRTVLDCYNILSDWMEHGNPLTLIAGNHDWSPKGEKLSSFHLLAALLSSRFPGQVEVVDQGLTEVGNYIWAIPHMPNQDLFDMELAAALGVATDPWPSDEPVMTHLVLHANYANKFCEHSDHSLNVSRGVAEKFVKAGVTLVFAHEHQAKQDFDGKVWIMGNQWSSSVSDCLGNNFKFAHRIQDGEISTIPTWSRTGPNGYVEIDWRDLAFTEPNWINPGNSFAGFIRVTGTATAEESEAVIEAIAKYRKVSEAFVIGNSVVVDGMAAMDSLAKASAETIKSFDVIGALLEGMNEREQKAIRSLI